MTTTDADTEVRAFSVGKALLGFIGSSLLAGIVTAWLTIEHHGGLGGFSAAEQPEIPFEAALGGMTAAAAFQLLWLLWMVMEFPNPARPLGLRITAADVLLGPLLYGFVVLSWIAIVTWLLPLYMDVDETSSETQLPAGFDAIPESQLLWLILIVGIAVPVIEELYFRGVILHAFEHRYGLGVALVASSVLFGVLHVEPMAILYTTWAGFFWALTTALTGRIGAAIIAHSLNNTVLMLIHTAPD